MDDYVDALEQHIDADLSGLNVLFDCANGASAKVAQKLFPRLGCQCSFTGTLDDGVSVNDGCGSTHLDRLEKKVVEGGFDCGIAFDGDADRCLACDEKGAEIDGDKIIALVAKDMKDRGRLDGNTAVVTVMSNLGFMKYMQSIGIDTARTAVGDRYVLEEMRARGYAIGGEQSGHVIFLHHSTTGDGELTAGKLLKLLARKHREEGTKMSELNAVYTKFPQVLINLTADKEQKQAYKEDEYIAGFIESQQQNLMGMGRVLVRVSGTEPKIRVMVEGEDMEAIQSSAERIADMIRQRIPGAVLMRPADTWVDYELIDATNHNRLERWAKALLIRPDPQIIWKNRGSQPPVGQGRRHLLPFRQGRRPVGLPQKAAPEMEHQMAGPDADRQPHRL